MRGKKVKRLRREFKKYYADLSGKPEDRNFYWRHFKKEAK